MNILSRILDLDWQNKGLGISRCSIVVVELEEVLGDATSGSRVLDVLDGFLHAAARVNQRVRAAKALTGHRHALAVVCALLLVLWNWIFLAIVGGFDVLSGALLRGGHHVGGVFKVVVG